MSEFFSPYDADRPLMLKCSCGQDHSEAEHHKELAASNATVELKRRSLTTEFEAYSNAFIEATLVKALFPQDAVRRKFLRAVGARQKRAGKNQPQNRLYSYHLCHAAHHGAPSGLLQTARPER